MTILTHSVMLNKSSTLVLFVVVYFITNSCGYFNPFTDNIYFAINWVGPDQILKSDDPLFNAEDSVVITTTNKEKYRCTIPVISDATNQDDVDGTAVVSELDLLKPLFEQQTCTYRLETYWTYELCHGRHLRQYHEEKEIGKVKTKLTEYFLGRYSMDMFWEALKLTKEHPQKASNLPKSSRLIKKVQGVEIPYFEVVFTDGTHCDLTGLPRRAAIQYVCQPDGRGEVYELKETSSCEYELIILTSLLCSHPAYGPKKDPVNTIECRSMDGAPRRPISLDALEMENTLGRYNSKHDVDDVTQPPFVVQQKPTPPERDRSKDRASGPGADRQILKDFLNGIYCIQGGSGWWKHEFCYGRHVTQYHEDKNDKIVIVLGEWDKDDHLDWILENPGKRPKDGKTISHFYGNGDICDTTSQSRSVEVKLRCTENPTHPNAVAIYLIEPHTCTYKLVVESPILCSIVQQADENGLIQNTIV